MVSGIGGHFLTESVALENLSSAVTVLAHLRDAVGWETWLCAIGRINHVPREQDGRHTGMLPVGSTLASSRPVKCRT